MFERDHRRRLVDGSELVHQLVAAEPRIGNVEHAIVQIREQRAVSLAQAPQMRAARRVRARGRIEIERQIDEQDDQRKARRSRPP